MSKRTIDPKSHNVAYWYFRPFWTDALNLYEPLLQTINLYIKRYPKEDDGEYAERLKSSAQINVCYLIVESTLSMIFSTAIEVTAEKFQNEVDAFWNSCTLQGDSVPDFLREQAGPAGFAYGVCDIVVDLPAPPINKLSVDRQKALGIRPYAYIVPPINRTAWTVDDYGYFTSYRSEDVLNTQVQGSMNLQGGPPSKKQYTEWTLEDVTMYDDNGTEQETKANPYGFIPIVTCSPCAKSLRYPNERLGRSLIQDVIPLQKLILNIMSLIYDYQENVNFPLRVYKHDEEAGEPPEEGELAEGGNKRGIIINGAGSDYKLVEPNPAGVDAMVRYLECLIEKSFQQVMQPSDANVNKTHQSSATIRSNHFVLFNKLTTYTKNLCKVAKEMVEMALLVQGISIDEVQKANIKVRWDTNFSLESFTNSLEQLSILKQTAADISPKAVTEFAKKVLNPQFYGSDSGVMQEIEAEMDDWVERQEQLAAAPPDQTPDTQPKTLQQNNTQISAAEKISDGEEGSY